MNKLAYLGLGTMGSGIAHNLMKSGIPLNVWNRTQSGESRGWKNAQWLAQEGATLCADISDAVRDADYIGLCLMGDADVCEVAERIRAFVKPGAVIVDNTTASPQNARKMQAFFKEAGAYYLDAPVSGGEKGARGGTLAIMVGGDEKAYQSVEPLLNCCAATPRYMGPSGSGEITKALNQMMVAINQAGVCEAFYYARKSGVDLENLFEILTNAWAKSAMLDRSVPECLIPDQYHTGARLRNMSKDLRIASKMAQDQGGSGPLFSAANAYYQDAEARGMGDLDIAAVIGLVEERLH